MHLKSVTLKGFKSFAQPTAFAFEPGVTCIVGPNGSGKSNVVDALAWVMGEQGAKTLRGGKMEDVIFAGTATRGPLGRAEVQLTIDNADGALPIEYAEVTISRTLFRNGASEYAINGDTCRLLDVQELLSDSGLGREMHVIVGQGRLDSVLQASPEERRGFIEEAAGILKHRRRKEKTLRKLDAMEANLTRLSDLAGELRRQLKPLGRQAEIAREAATIAAVVRDAKARLFADELVGLRTELADHARSEHERHAERMVLQEQLDDSRLRIEGLEAAQRAEGVDEARQVAFALERVQERVRGLYSLAGQRLALLSDRPDEDLADRATVSQATIDDVRDEIEEIAAGLGDAQDAATAAARDVVRAPGRPRCPRLRHRRAERAGLGARDAHHRAPRRERRPRHPLSRRSVPRSNVRRAPSTRRSRAARPPRRRSPGSTPSWCRRVRRPSSRPPTTARSAPPRTSRPRSARSASGCTPPSARSARSPPRPRRSVVRSKSAMRPRRSSPAAGTASADSWVTRSRSRRATRRRSPQRSARSRRACWSTPPTTPSRRPPWHATATSASSTSRSPRRSPHERESPRSPAPCPRSMSITAPDGVREALAHVLVADDLDAAQRVSAALAGTAGAAAVTIVTRTGEVVTAHTLRAGSGQGRSRLELAAERDAAAERLAEMSVVSDSLREVLAEKVLALETTRQKAKQALASLRAHDAALAAHAEQVNRASVTP